MTLTDEQKKLLTVEVLHECWHEFKLPNKWDDGNICIHCEKRIGYVYSLRRTFDNEADMMALYRAFYKNDKWKDLEEHLCCLVAQWLEVRKQ